MFTPLADLASRMRLNTHTGKSSSSSDDLSNGSNRSGESSPFTSSGITSPATELSNSFDLGKATDAHLPEPFFPATIVDTKDAKSLKARPLPDTLPYPSLPQEEVCRVIDQQDKGTPDEWVPRDSRMVRLTGKHPFNAEARLKDLYSYGFFTPSNLFFVRNHGAVPKIDEPTAREWKVEISGLCQNPVTFSLNDLRSMFEVVTMPITLVCAGNRRKEQNVVQKSLGFSWGAGGLSTALFTGVRLSDVLEFVQPQKGAKHVIFEGGDSLPNGPYGTSQLLSWARDRRKGMMLAWAMNGLPLEPDHGFPIRLVVPGQIGGRSVKWLRKIELSHQESQHHLHFHDNKVLPMPLGPDRARAEKDWWYDPRYIIRDLNVNSAVACPDHDEVLQVTSTEKYTLRGYAYAGGGRRVTRVEISFDEGTTWELAQIHYLEDHFRDVPYDDSIYGTLDLTESDQSFCWCFWSFEVGVEVLKSASSITVRAMDESLALQPRDMYWNATGMMNNWWFRVCIHHLEDGSLKFEHPTMAGTQPGGWMQRLKDAGQDPSKPEFNPKRSASSVVAKPAEPVEEVKMTKPGVTRKITLEELAAHAHDETPWFVVRGEVYDATEYLNEHPGGLQSITLVAGDDATEDFIAIHSADAKRKLAEYHIGTLVGSLVEESKPEASDPTIFLHPKQWKAVRLVSTTTVSRDSKIFRFQLDTRDQTLGLPTGQHVYVRLKRKVERDGKKVADGELVQRAYTPLSRDVDKGFIDMLVKIYYPCNEYPLGGRMTLGFAELEEGDVVDLKGPIGHFTWLGSARASIHGKEHSVGQVGMVCAGSGITPILQVLRGIFEDSRDTTTKVWVLDVNRHFEDILCKAELDDLLEKYPDRLQLRYSLTGRPLPDGWSQSTGRITRDMLVKYLPEPSEDGIVCICGPPPMEQSVKDTLREMGWCSTNQIIIF
ncbi:acyl-CoA dehydrogenase [Coprinopsis cinerea AmutBmut pab1-1]|nr:acyl-CoA dehydrogenase [Coprinopsis cinerea AmutBmut pab1-1]